MDMVEGLNHRCPSQNTLTWSKPVQDAGELGPHHAQALALPHCPDRQFHYYCITEIYCPQYYLSRKKE